MRSILKAIIVVGIIILFAPYAEASNIITVTAVRDSDYVVLKSGDTVLCKLKFNLTGTLRYKPNDAKQWKDVTIAEIKGYGVASTSHPSRALFIDGKKDPEFMVLMEGGKINLYQQLKTNMRNMGGGMYASDTRSYYITNGSDTVKKIKSDSPTFLKSRKDREDELGAMLKDNKDVFDLYMEERKFSFDMIRKYIRLYNTGVWENGLKADDY